MFLVPKFLLDEEGRPGARNDYKVVSLEHKLGIHASPTCVISFGDGGEGAVGYLVGEEHQGMRNMFTMMNPARIGVGMEGLAMSERAYQDARAFAHGRLQGRAIGRDGDGQVPIIEHPDVRRMLLTMRANIEAMRCFLYFAAKQGDYLVHGASPEERERAGDMLALLTPVVKAWNTDLGVEMTSLAIQVHGGMGYVEETGVAQHMRDARIAPIYEGTNGIQAMDLVLRKLPLRDGEVVTRFLTHMSEAVGPARDHEDLRGAADALQQAIAGLADTSTWLGQRLVERDLDAALAGATPYLRQFGTVVGGWLMLVSATVAKDDRPDFTPEFLEDKVNTARFYLEHLLPLAAGLVPTIKGGAALLSNARL
jgi:hypothetical protein